MTQLGGGFGPGFKVAGGYDFVGNGSKFFLITAFYVH